MQNHQTVIRPVLQVRLRLTIHALLIVTKDLHLMEMQQQHAVELLTVMLERGVLLNLLVLVSKT